MKLLEAFLASAGLQQYHLYTVCQLPQAKMGAKKSQGKLKQQDAPNLTRLQALLKIHRTAKDL